MQLQSRPSRQPVINKHTSDWAKPSGVNTEHEAPKGPGWLEVAEDERDGLDDMISGLKNGSVPEEAEEQTVSQHDASQPCHLIM
jgi:DNA polymerase lambda